MNIEQDTQYTEYTLTSVTRVESDGGYTLGLGNSSCFYMPPSEEVVPAVGMKAKLYGKGFGYTVRGLVVDGKTVFYRTEAEEKIYRANELYGADAVEWLRRWDAGSGVWTIEMSKTSPAMENAMQYLMAEMLRYLVEHGKGWQDDEGMTTALKSVTDSLRDRCAFTNEQEALAARFAMMIYKYGPVAIFQNAESQGLHTIQTRKSELKQVAESAKEGDFGDTAAEWLRRWDAGQTVWSVSMGGMGPGYEDCIQNLTVETLRYFINNQVNLETEDAEQRELIKKGMDGVADELDKKYGFSGAQVGAARNLAAVIYRRGPADAFADPQIKDRLIQISKDL